MFTRNSKQFLLLAALVLAFFALNGCSSDDDPADPGGGGSSDAPVFSAGAGASIELPAGLESSNDPNAQLVAGYMAQVNILASMSNIFDVPDGAKKSMNKDSSWEYTWSINEPPVVMSMTLTVRELSESYTWTLRIDGTDGEITFDNDIVYFAEAAKDESYGSFYYYDIEGDVNDVIFSWEWSTDSAGVFTMTMIAGDDTEGFKSVFVVNPDGSGTLDIYENVEMSWQILLHFEWDALGNGSWIVYEDGVESASGNWYIGGNR